MSPPARHRGAHPDDPRLFGLAAVPVLRTAVGELSWLLTRGYAEPSSLKLVGDRHRLDRRQRAAVRRSACSDAALARRLGRRTDGGLSGEEVSVDGYNVLTTTETALGGGVVLRGRDGACRDVAGLHGTWRRVHETRPAIITLGEALQRCGAGPCTWLLDRPVSNSGRLKQALLEVAAERGWRWEVEVVPDPDPVLARSATAVATADSAVLDRCGRWLDLTGTALAARPGVWLVDLGLPGPAPLQERGVDPTTDGTR